MRSRARIIVGGLVAAIAAGAVGCATPAAKEACFPVAGWAAPEFRCAGGAAPTPQVAVTPPPPPEPAKPEPARPEPTPEPATPPPPPPPRATMAKERIELSETVQFETDSAVLVGRSKELLDDVVRELTEHPEVKRVLIEGHTDNVASNRHNVKLSQQRVASVKAYLVSKGVNPKRLATKAFGETKPIASNKTEEGRAKNRRVDFRVMSRK
jgi:OOP family OmpA-OmpF porin